MRIIKDDKNQMGTNSYLVIMDNKDCYIIDCPSKLLDFQDVIEKEALNLKYILLTHGHFDHIMGATYLRDKYKTKIVAHREERSVLIDKNINLSSMINSPMEFEADIYLEGKEGIFEDFKYLFTPGHTSGGVSYLVNNCIFTGDTVFYGSIGRTDFPGGDYITLINYIEQQILTLPLDTIIYPGHGQATNVEFEKNNNPFLK